MAADPLARLVGFAAYLREHGFAVGHEEVALMARTAAALPPETWPQVATCWRSIAAGNHRQWLLYPALHQSFWRPQAQRGSVRSAGQGRRGRTLPELVERLRNPDDGAAPSSGSGRALAGVAAGQPEGDSSATLGQGGASRCEALERRDFSAWQAGDEDRYAAVVAAFARRLRRRLLRRWRPQDGARIALRRTLRDALATGGELLRLRYARRRLRLPRIALLVDVSRSMETHARFFLRLARVFVEVTRARVFVFHTRLAEAGPLMTARGDRVQQRVDAMTAGFGGGTRIATCLRQALQGPLRRSLGRGDLFMVFSDGYDTDEPEALALALGLAQARGIRVYWLHPTAAPSSSAALTLAAGQVTRFLPVHDLASLARLPELLDTTPARAGGHGGTRTWDAY